MENSNLPFMAELTTLASKRLTGRLSLQKRDGTELNLFVETGKLVHAQFGWTFGMAAMQEAITWRNYSTSFTLGIAAPVRSLSDEDRSKIEQGLGQMVEETKYAMNVTNGYYYAESQTSAEINEYETRVLTNANGNSFSEMLALTELNTASLEQLLKQLLQKKLLRVEKTPATPERLKALRLRKKEPKSKGILGVFGKKTIELTDLEFRVYDLLNGAMTLWDIHLNSGLSRDEIWEAYISLEKRDLVEKLT
jgi:hypothetical protein